MENTFIDGLPNSGTALLFFFFFLIIILQIIQKLVEEKLTALQCAVFDKTLADLKTRIEKVECNKRHKTLLTELQVSVCMNCILDSNLKISLSIFSSKSPGAIKREPILSPQRKRGGGGERILQLESNASIHCYFPTRKEASNQLILKNPKHMFLANRFISWY